MPDDTATATATATSNPPAPGGTIVIDHTCTDISRIPDYWLAKAKELTLHYAHTSRGSQIISGALALEEQNPEYGIAVNESDIAPALPAETGVMRIYDGNPPETYITPQGDCI